MADKRKSHLPLNVPADFSMTLLLVAIDGDGEAVTINAEMDFPKGRFPTKKMFDSAVERAIETTKEKMNVTGPSVRVATKAEFWNNLCIERSGQRLAYPGDLTKWDEVDHDEK